MEKDQVAVIDDCRSKITSIDQEIFTLIKKREQLSAQIGEAKRGLNIPDRDVTREKAVFDHAMTLARTLDLPQGLAASLQQLIINVSLSRQERDRIKNNPPEKILKIAIIGGAGRMGAWFSQFLADSGHEISIIDKIKPNFDVKYSSELDQSIGTNDVIIIATPIRISIDILEKLKNMALKKPIIFDLSSIKAPVYDALSRLRDDGVLVTSLHPMFGPSVQLLFGKHIILTSMGMRKADECARELFKSTALTVLEMSIEEHDEAMSYVLSLSHLLNIIFVLTLKESPIPLTKLAHLASPTFSHVLSQARKVFDENHHLYYEIQALNTHNNKSFDKLSGVLRDLIKAVTHKKEDDFVALMKAGQNYLGRSS
jgi:chorismate mutase/prephenate dehydrogenase